MKYKPGDYIENCSPDQKNDDWGIVIAFNSKLEEYLIYWAGAKLKCNDHANILYNHYELSVDRKKLKEFKENINNMLDGN